MHIIEQSADALGQDNMSSCIFRCNLNLMLARFTRQAFSRSLQASLNSRAEKVHANTSTVSHYKHTEYACDPTL